MVHQKIIKLFIDAYIATYIKNHLRMICADKGVGCAIHFKYKMGCNVSLQVILQGQDLNILNEIELKLTSLNGEVVEELTINEIESKEPQVV